MKRLLLFPVIAAVLMGPDGRAQESQAALPTPTVDYESFCKQDAVTKKILVAKMKPDHCVKLTLTHRQRWLDANRANLTPQQIGAIQEWIKKITPIDCTTAIVEESMARAKAFEGPRVIFTRAQLDEMSLAGPCVAKKAP
jgi:hypothetical protein